MKRPAIGERLRFPCSLPRLLAGVGVWALLAGAPFAVEKPVSDRVDSALADAERLATAGQWRAALAAGDRLRVACRDLRGEQHPDTALAELFLGEVRDHLGERNLAETHFRRALAIQEQVLPRAAPELVTTLTRLGALLKDQRRYDEAIGLLERALDAQARRSGEDLETAVACRNLARVLRSKGELRRAVPLFERALRIQRVEVGGTDPETLAGLQEIAEAQEAAGDLAAAEMATGERVVGTEAIDGAEAPELTDALMEWARLAERQEHWTDVEVRCRRALDSARNQTGGLAATRAKTQLGWSLVKLNRHAEAKPLLEQAMEERKRAAGTDDVETAAIERQLGWLFRTQRDYAAALPHFSRVLEIRERVLGANDLTTLESLEELGDLRWLAGDFDEAAALHERRRYRVESVTGPTSAETAAASHSLALVYESAKRWTQATDAALRSMKLVEQLHGSAAPETLSELLLLSRICAAAGALDPALMQYARLAGWFAQHPEVSPEARARLQRSYAIAAHRAGRANAEALFRESRRLHVAALGATHPDALRALGDLWTYYSETRQPQQALRVAGELVAETERALGADAPAVAEVWERLGQLQITLGDREAAMVAFRRSLGNLRKRGLSAAVESLAALARIAGFFEEVRDFARAAEFREERLKLAQQTFAFGSVEEAAASGELGLNYFRLREFLPARGMFEHQRALAEQRAGADCAEALLATARLGDVAVGAGDLKTALRERERLVAGCARSFGGEHAEHGRALLLLGEALAADDDVAGAGRAWSEAQRILHAARPDDPLLSRVIAGRAIAALRQGREAEARRWTRDALTGAMPQDEAMAEVLTRLGDAWLAAGDVKTGDRPLDAALAILTQVAGDQDEQTLALLRRVGRTRLESGSTDAAALLERACAGTEALDGREAPALVDLLGWLALAERAEGRVPEAQAAAERRVTLIEKLGTADPALREEARALRAWTRLDADAPAEIRAFFAQRFPWLAQAVADWW